MCVCVCSINQKGKYTKGKQRKERRLNLKSLFYASVISCLVSPGFPVLKVSVVLLVCKTKVSVSMKVHAFTSTWSQICSKHEPALLLEMENRVLVSRKNIHTSEAKAESKLFLEL